MYQFSMNFWSWLSRVGLGSSFNPLRTNFSARYCEWRSLWDLKLSFNLLQPINLLTFNLLYKWVVIKHRVLKSHRSKMDIMYMCMLSWKQGAFPVITTMLCGNFHLVGTIAPILLLWDLSTLCVVDRVDTTYITLLAQFVEHSMVHWYQQCVAVDHLPKCMSCNKAIAVIT